MVFTSRRCPRVGTFHRLSHMHLAISHALPLNALPSPSITFRCQEWHRCHLYLIQWSPSGSASTITAADVACIRYSDFYAVQRSFVFDTVISLRLCEHHYSSNDVACIRYSDFTPSNGHLYLIQWSPSGSANTITAATISLAFDAAIFTAMDTADLRQVMRAALQKTSDAEMLGVLGVGVSWNDTNCFKPLICVWILQDVISPLQLHIGSPDPDCFRASGMKTSIRWKED